MRPAPFIFLALLAGLLCGCAPGPGLVVRNAAQIDARNRLLSVGGVTNAYDMSGNRVGLVYGTNSSVFVINPNSALPQVLMRIKNGVTNYYVYGAGLLYQITEAATGTNTVTYHYDYRGNTIALSADNGAVTDRIEYSAYGLSVTVRLNRLTLLGEGMAGWRGETTIIKNPHGPATSHPQRDRWDSQRSAPQRALAVCLCPKGGIVLREPFALEIPAPRRSERSGVHRPRS